MVTKQMLIIELFWRFDPGNMGHGTPDSMPAHVPRVHINTWTVLIHGLHFAEEMCKCLLCNVGMFSVIVMYSEVAELYPPGDLRIFRDEFVCSPPS